VLLAKVPWEMVNEAHLKSHTNGFFESFELFFVYLERGTMICLNENLHMFKTPCQKFEPHVG
jgi:hypothetical protein